MAAVAAGGSVGAGVRWAVVAAGPHTTFPWMVLAVNVAGSFVLGMVLAEEWTHPRAHLALHDVLGIGFCGGLTTFSTFAVEIVDLGRAHHAGLAVVYGTVSVASALAAIVLGAALLRGVRAVVLPLEEEP